ncbi:heparinase II/III family protein [Burkholderiales bacterium]|nr:heparinase II/III family protein [Burkholderiales bacterium]
MHDLIGKIRRGLRKPPGVIVERLLAMARTQTERLRLPGRSNLSQQALLRELQAPSLDALWRRLAARPFPAWFGPCDVAEVDTLCDPYERIALQARAENALAHRVDLLGSGLTELGAQIDWHTDFKTGLSWSPRYFADIDYNNPERPSDVKVPWELSRLQWLMPVGQAFLLTRDDRYAAGLRDVLEQWITANPCGGSVNWSCTMEAALRIFSWVWFFHVFQDAPSWRDTDFRFRFLRALYLHVEFTDRHIERSDVNGNHYTADAAALVVGGLFFGEGRWPQRWQQEGWRILCEEMSRQVFSDGVDFEASVPYHRLVAELFLWPAMYRTAQGLSIDPNYTERLSAMARFSCAYSRPDGSVPLWGDADDARALPFGMQDINDHRYLHTLIGLYTGQQDLCHDKPAAVGEVLWAFGPSGVRRWLNALPSPPASQAFEDGGFYVMRSARDHVFIDCGPLGLSGRGGHGHNDCLAFEAVLDGVPLVSDCGAYLYTASFEERNRFRSTAYHNTPQVDGEEINRFIRPDYLWNLHYDAVPRVHKWQVKKDYVLFVGEHRGYCRLTSPVIPRRSILLDCETHALHIKDEFLGEGMHDVTIPMHLAPGVEVSELKDCELLLSACDKHFRVWWLPVSGYSVSVDEARVSSSYGVVHLSKKLVWSRASSPLVTFNLFIAPFNAPSRIFSDMSIYFGLNSNEP